MTEKELEILNGQSATDFTIQYFSDVALTNEISNPSTFPNSTTIQTIYVKIFNNLNSSCVAYTNFNIEVYKLPVITNLVSLKQCDDDTDGYSAFNLTEVNTKISTDAVNETFSYFYSYLGANSNDINDKIVNPITYINQTVSTNTIWARVENLNGCQRVSEVNLIVSTTGIPSSFQKVYYECDDYLDTVNNDRDGISSFDFSEVTTEIENLFPIGQQLIIKYYRNEADALAEINAIINPSNYRNIGYQNTQNIYIRVDSELDNDCLGFGAHITLHVEPLPIANSVTISRQCDDDFDGFFNFDVA
ncbi:MAG: CUB protein, partial [Lutibacter sp.]